MRMRLIAAVVLLGCSGGGGGGGGGVTPPPPPPPPPPETGTVQGTITDEADAGVAGAGITLSRTGSTSLNTTTGATGAFSFATVATGAWTVTATPPNGWEAAGALTANVQVAANQTATVPAMRMRRVETPLPPESAAVNIGDNVFTPGSVTIRVGGRVLWTNTGAQIHNSTGPNWTSPNINPGSTFERVFPAAGTFNYTCTLHPGMNGTVVVQ